MRGETSGEFPATAYVIISIHSPHAGRDPLPRPVCKRHVHFNPLAPCGARPSPPDQQFRTVCPFQSTRPMRGETVSARRSGMGQDHFNPLAPCGARPQLFHRKHATLVFQSTRPMRGETYTTIHHLTGGVFQSTRPMRGETRLSVST